MRGDLHPMHEGEEFGNVLIAEIQITELPFLHGGEPCLPLSLFLWQLEISGEGVVDPFLGAEHDIGEERRILVHQHVAMIIELAEGLCEIRFDLKDAFAKEDSGGAVDDDIFAQLEKRYILNHTVGSR